VMYRKKEKKKKEKPLQIIGSFRILAFTLSTAAGSCPELEHSEGYLIEENGL
jgi:hypothetical protein